MSTPGKAERHIGTALLLLAVAIIAAFLVSVIADLLGVGAGGDAPAHLDPGVGPETIRVEVLNGSGTPGLARRATEVLRDGGFDVVFYGNATSFSHDSTLVLARAERAPADAVARVLGVGTVRIEADTTLVLDVTVILGRDWPRTAAGRQGWLDRLLAELGLNRAG